MQRFDGLQKALSDPEATLELLVPEGRKEMGFIGIAKSAAMTMQVQRCVS